MTRPIQPIDEIQRLDALQFCDDERTRLALENAGVGIWDLDYTTGLLTWSAATEAHYGLQPGAFGRTQDAFLDCVHPADRNLVQDAFQKAAASGDAFSVEH